MTTGRAGTVGTDYDARAQEYADFIADPANHPAFTTPAITGFAETVRRAGGSQRVLDAGCGPGHWTSYLRVLGLDAEGIDASAAAVAIAARRWPDAPVRVGSLLDLDAPDATYGGVLAHYSLIHTPPADVPRALAGFARVLEPGGTLLVAGQSLDDAPVTPFDHTVSPAWAWSEVALAEVVTAAGFDVTTRLRIEPEPGKRFVNVYLLARLPDGDHTRP